LGARLRATAQPLLPRHETLCAQLLEAHPGDSARPAPTSRITRAMREHLGKARWRSFVAYAKAHYKEQFVSAFEPDSGVIACAGPIEGGPYPQAFVVRVDDPGACELLESLHFDHTHDVGNVCSVWRASVPKGARGWSAGIDRSRQCRMLFGVTAADGLEQCLHFRCGSSRGAGGHRVARLCHSPRAHWAHSVSDLCSAPVLSSRLHSPVAGGAVLLEHRALRRVAALVARDHLSTRPSEKRHPLPRHTAPIVPHHQLKPFQIWALHFFLRQGLSP
jgi:hypothetical protein